MEKINNYVNSHFTLIYADKTTVPNIPRTLFNVFHFIM